MGLATSKKCHPRQRKQKKKKIDQFDYGFVHQKILSSVKRHPPEWEKIFEVMYLVRD